MSRDLAFHRLAREDLFSLSDFIEQRSGSERALGFLDRIEAACRGLIDFPEKGVPRDDIATGLRTWPVERRVLIAYRLTGDQVEILRVLYAGRDFRADALPE